MYVSGVTISEAAAGAELKDSDRAVMAAQNDNADMADLTVLTLAVPNLSRFIAVYPLVLSLAVLSFAYHRLKP
jgi:hypothetical protein